MIYLEGSKLRFDFRSVHPSAHCDITFQRTLRLPDDNRSYPLPPGLGEFPLFHLEDYAAKVPKHWSVRGGVFFPMYQSEAMWLYFSGRYPVAIKIAAGKVNAVSGEPWRDELSDSPQDYAVVPGQPWLDGFCVEKGLIRQFVAMPLGGGFTAEEQLTGKAEFGGIQLCVYPMKRDFYERWQESLKQLPSENYDCIRYDADAPRFMRSRRVEEPSMGLAPGGLMRQEIFEDEHGLDAWDTSAMARCFVHLVNSEQFHSITAQAPPQPPVTAKDYTQAGLPWFDYYDHDRKALAGAAPLAGLDSLAAKMIKVGKKILPDNEPVTPKRVVAMEAKGKVSDGRW